MKRTFAVGFIACFFVVVAIGAAAPATTVSPVKNRALEWDAKLKEYQAKATDVEAKFTFTLTNTSTAEVVVKNVRTSCGCTVAELPSKPWHIPAGGAGDIGVTVNLRGRVGTITKSVFVDSSEGMHPLSVRVHIPGGKNRRSMSSLTDRQRNQLIALRDPQAIFRNKCASCHATPAKDKHGEELYTLVCGVCHDSHNRASMVPDLRALKHPTDEGYWRHWITHGKKGSLMPGFTKKEGGPLDDDQIESLVAYLTKTVSENKSAVFAPDFDDIVPPTLPDLPQPPTAPQTAPDGR
jgi:mono/diheme cytochrome c family protein